MFKIVQKKKFTSTLHLFGFFKNSFANFKFLKTFETDKFPETFQDLDGTIKNFGGKIVEHISNNIDAGIIRYEIGIDPSVNVEIFIDDSWEELHLESNDQEIFDKIVKIMNQKQLKR